MAIPNIPYRMRELSYNIAAICHYWKQLNEYYHYGPTDGPDVSKTSNSSNVSNGTQLDRLAKLRNKLPN